MALIKCPECGHDISDKASVCPNCGCPVQCINNVRVASVHKTRNRESGKLILSIAVIIAAIVFIPIFMSYIKKESTTHLSDLTFEVDKSTGRTYALKNGRAFDGIARSDDENLFSIHVSDGWVDHLEICHKNGRTAVRANMDIDESDIFFFDEEGNEMSAQAFYITYPAIVAETMNVQKQMNGL